MFVQIKNFAITGLWKINNGFQVQFENKDGYMAEYQFSDITLKFYHVDGRKMKLPKYFAKEVIEMACRKKIVFMSDIQKEDALYFL